MKGFNIYWGSAVSLLFFLGVGVVSAKFFNITGGQFAFLMILMGTLGISSTAFFAYFQNKLQQKKQASLQGAAAGGARAVAAQAGSPEIDQLIKDADQRLAASKGMQGATIGNLPLFFIIGDQGATKTSVMVHSGLEPELLAGQVYQGNDIVSTASANVWLARSSIFVEAGGRLLAKSDSWTRLIKKLQPGKLKSVIGKGQQSPRAVLLCFDAEQFTQSSPEQITATARVLQTRLGEISQTLGISFPVYVLFSRADRLGFFGDFFRNLSNEETTQVFGVTLPLQHARSGVYAEEESRRLNWAFNELLYSLCDRRIDFLPREHDPEKLPGAYEFPREFRKLRASLVQLLVDLCRPSQLRASPFLRGFYFSAVRPVVINDVAQTPMRAAAPVGQKTFDAGATRMFRAGMDLPQSAAAAAPQQVGTRRVPQWMFLSQLFTNVMLQDRAAMAASGSSVKVSGMRRLLLGLGSLLFLILSGMFLWSYLNNRSLEKEAIAAAQDLSGQRVTGSNLPSVASLQKLDRLRGVLQQLTDWDKTGHPFMYKWFLYRGHDLLPHTRTAYYRSFKDLLFGQVQGNWITYLQSVKIPPAPTDDYGFGYNTLKGYLLTSSEWKRTKEKVYQDFLADTLTTRWPAGRDAAIDKQMSDLAKAQFDFYSRDLPNGNPYSDQAQADTVERARDYLSRFSGIDRIYQALLTEAASKGKIVIFNHDYPGSERVMRNTYPVPAAFTKNALPYMNQLIADAERRFSGEKWVLGEGRGPTVTDWTALKKQLTDKYLAEYIANWRKFLAASHFAGYGSIEEVPEKLGIISANDSLYMRLFWVLSTNTAVDPKVKAAFQPAHIVETADSPVLINDTNRGYMTALNGLQLTMQGNPDPGAVDTAQKTATSARFQISSGFQPDSEAHVDNQISQLLQEPITGIPNPMLQRLNAAGRQFCAASGFGRFPFNGNPKSPDASLQEVNDIFRPKEGALWKFYEGTLKQALTCTASGCTATGNLPLNPAFVAFMTEAMRFSNALYRDAAAEPALKYSVTPRSDKVDTFAFTVDGNNTVLKSGSAGNFTWSGSTNRFAIGFQLAGGGSLTVPPYEGLWAPFRFFADADINVPSGTNYKFIFRQRQGKSERLILEYEALVDTHGAPALFSKNFWQQLRCISTVTK